MAWIYGVIQNSSKFRPGHPPNCPTDQGWASHKFESCHLYCRSFYMVTDDGNNKAKTLINSQIN